MYDSIFYKVEAHWIAIAIFLLILLTNWLGFRYRKFQEAKPGIETINGAGPMESSMLGLMALMLGFTFSMAISKFETRRQIIVEEANNIGTALLRADLYPDSIRTLLRADFKDYVEARIFYYNAGIDKKKIDSALIKTNVYSGRLWKRAADLVQNDRYRVSNLQLIPALNSMIDIVSVRESGRKAKVPTIILTMLFLLTLLSSFLVGYGHKGKRRNLVMICTFSVMTTIALYLILELDRPRRGMLNLDAAEQNITALRELFNK
ncbi:hypothetical protein ACPPVU_03105 [Mucilaginibacter sp. McL0603]|uniref:bestrophin-like domain n=1 Tax=Mucilaginibacter sp. McL0603 TaxID=3415670 RepID=UPI003CF1DAE9